AFPERVGPPEAGAGLLTEQDGTASQLGELLDALGKVDRLADRGELAPVTLAAVGQGHLGPHAAGDRHAGVDADPHFHRGLPIPANSSFSSRRRSSRSSAAAKARSAWSARSSITPKRAMKPSPRNLLTYPPWGPSTVLTAT